MAIRTRLEDGSGSLGDMPDIALTDGRMSEKTALEVSSKIREIISRFNRGFSLGSGLSGYKAGNLDAQTVDVLTPSVANTEFAVPHGLLRRPVGYIVIRADRAVSVYDSSAGSWGDDTMYLKASVASATIRLLVF